MPMANVLAMAHPGQQVDESNPRLALIQERLGESLADYVDHRRGSGTAWRRIAIELYQKTQVDITGEALRQWHVGRAS